MGKYRVILYYLWFLGLDFIFSYYVYYAVSDLFCIQFNDGFQFIMLSPFFVVFFLLVLVQVIEVKFIFMLHNFLEGL